MPREKQMNEVEARFYKDRMKKIRDALKRGDEEAAQYYAREIKEFFNVR